MVGGQKRTYRELHKLNFQKKINPGVKNCQKSNEEGAKQGILVGDAQREKLVILQIGNDAQQSIGIGRQKKGSVIGLWFGSANQIARKKLIRDSWLT